MITLKEYKNIIDLSPYYRPEYLPVNEREKYLDILISYFSVENNIKIPSFKDYNQKRSFLKMLFNIREPLEVTNEIISSQDRLLWSETVDKNILDVEDFIYNDNLTTWKGDITRLKANAIVNAANSQLLGCFNPSHYCIDNVIHSASGIQLRLDCNKIINLQKQNESVGNAKVTNGYNLPAKYVIHTVGPHVSYKLTKLNIEKLGNCYISSLNLARDLKLKNIVFCCISTGIFSFPNKEACEIAINTVKNWLKTNQYDIKVVFNTFKDIDEELYNEKIL